MSNSTTRVTKMVAMFALLSFLSGYLAIEESAKDTEPLNAQSSPLTLEEAEEVRDLVVESDEMQLFLNHNEPRTLGLVADYQVITETTPLGGLPTYSGETQHIAYIGYDDTSRELVQVSFAFTGTLTDYGIEYSSGLVAMVDLSESELLALLQIDTTSAAASDVGTVYPRTLGNGYAGWVRVLNLGRLPRVQKPSNARLFYVSLALSSRGQ